MSTREPRPLLLPDAGRLEQIRLLLNEGRSLDVLEKIQDLAPLEQWVAAGPLEAFYASRLMSWLGNGRRSDAMDRIARQRYPDSPEVFLRWMSTVGRMKGPLAMLQLIRDRTQHPPMEERHRFFLLNIEAEYWSRWSDFHAAHRCLDEAEKLRPGHDRVRVNRASVLMREDRRREAMVEAEAAIRIRPGNVSAPQLLADLLRAEGREEEARAVLEEAMQRVQDGDVVLALANWHSEHGEYDKALELSITVEALNPLASRSLRAWLAGWRAYRQYLSGRVDQALEEAARAPRCFITEIADRLRAGAAGERVLLPVPFVKQDRRTCAPATLAAICRYFGDAAEHVEIAEKICYDGTPDHSERKWAEQRGYVVREFRVDRETVIALVDRGLPFTLTTVEPASAHLQAVIGYDTRAGTLLVREPGWADYAEYRLKLLDDYAFSGPRGMVLVPPEKAELLAGLTLPEAPLYDALHACQVALHENDREAGLAALQSLEEQAPGHRLALLARRQLGSQDRNSQVQLSAVNAMLELFPDQPALLYEKLWLLAETAGRKEQMSFARTVQAAGKAPPEVDRLMAELLDDDARDWPAAEAAWQRAVRRRPYQGAVLGGLADFRWSQMRRRESVLCYRLAACQDVMWESPARRYFSAARYVGAEELAECLAFLRWRVEKHGALSGDPACTLAWALGQTGRDGEALRVLEEAVRLRPEDGSLLLAAAGHFRNSGQTARAAELLALAENRVPQGDWLRRKAREAVSQADLSGAIGFYQQLLEIEPSRREVHQALVDLLAGTAGPAAAVAHLEEACAAFPGHAGLHSLLCQWLDAGVERRSEVLRHLLELNPADTWARRELAMELKKRGRHQDAVAEARLALEVEPNAASSHGILADVLEGAGQLEEARRSLREALVIDVDYVWAISRLIELAPDLSGKQAELGWIRDQMEAQVLEGNGLMRWQSEAWRLWEPDAVLAVLEEVKAARPDLWYAWSVMGKHLSDMGEMDRALQVAGEAAERFPLLPRVWYDLALIRGRMGDIAGERQALEEALRINPDWDLAVERLAVVCRNLDDAPAARALLERHTRSNPLDQGVMLELIGMLRTADDREALLEACRRAVALAPLSDEAWRMRAAVAQDDPAEMEQAVTAVALLTKQLPLSLKAWECRAAVASKTSYAAELAVLDEALVSLPGHWDLLDRKALLLAEMARYDEALACCLPSGENDPEARWKKGRAADILYRQGKEREAITALEQLAVEHPDYQWAVGRLVEWHEHQADHEAVLLWSARQSRLEPHVCYPLGYRAGALLALNRKEEAEEALRRAVVLEPGYTWAVKQLLGLELGRKDLDAAARTVARVRGRTPVHEIAALYNKHGFASGAEALCRSAVAMNASEASNHEALGEALWRLDRREEALDCWREALNLKPAWSRLARQLWTRAADCGATGRMKQEMRGWALADPPDELRLQAWLNFLEEDAEVWLEACGEAITRLPECRKFAELKAERLSRLKRYTAALELCDQYDRPDSPDVLMLRRRAAIEADRGHLPVAIQLMEKALGLEPDSRFGLEKICDWLETEGRAAAAVPHALRLVEVAPGTAVSFGYLASALIRSDRAAEAEVHLFRALRMMPGYGWAGDQLFQLLMERRDYEAVGRVVKLLQEHQPGSSSNLKRLRLAAVREEKTEAFDAWQAMAEADSTTAYEFSRAEEFLLEAGWRLELDDAWQAQLARPGLTAGAVTSWVGRCYALKKYKVWKKFEALPGGEPIRVAAWEKYLDAAGELRHEPQSRQDKMKRAGMKAIRRNQEALRQPTVLWANVVYFYLSAKSYRQGRAWSRDWQSYPDARQWMLHNVAVLHEGRWTRRGGGEIRRWALENLPPDHTTVRHRIHLAFEAAADGRTDEAREWLTDLCEPDIPEGGSGSGLRLMKGLTRVLLRLQDGSLTVAQRRKLAATDYDQALQETATALTYASHGATLRTFLPVAFRKAGVGRLFWKIIWSVPPALGVDWH